MPVLILELRALIPYNVHFSSVDTYLIVLVGVTLKLYQRFMADLNFKGSELTLPQRVTHSRFLQGTKDMQIRLSCRKVTSA